MEKIIKDVIDLLDARMDVINQAEQTKPNEEDLNYIDGKKTVYIGFREALVWMWETYECKNDIEKRKSFLRYYMNLYRGRWDKFNYDCSNNNGRILKSYGNGIYDKMRGRRDACSDIYHELKRMLEVIPDA